jgi:hypothetical protein
LRVEPSRPLTFSEDAVDAAYLTELALLEDGDPHAHVQRKTEDLEARLAKMERSHIKTLLRRIP